MRKTVVRRSLLALAISASFPCLASAQDGSWSVDASGNWSDTANWASSIPATGSGFTATFANDITADRTITLDTARTITNLTFGDADTSTAGGWNISGANALTLAGTTPTITVNALGAGKAVNISAAVSGTVGFTKAGPGLLQLSGSLSGMTAGTFTVNGGTLQFANDTATGGAVGRTLAGSGTVIFTGANTGAPSGSVSSYNIGGANGSFSGTMVADNARMGIDSTADVGTATLVNSGNGQFFFSVAGPFSNNMTVQGIGWGEAAGNLGAIRFTGTTLSGQITLADNARFVSHGSTGTASGAIIETGGARTLEIGGSSAGSNITLSGANTYTGGTIINGTYSVTGANTGTTLNLNYATQDNSKLGNSGVLTFRGLSTLAMAGGTHTELVGSTTLEAGAIATINRTSAGATLNLGALNRNPGATLNVGTASIASTSSGIAGEAFGSWFTLGTELATKDGSNNIVAVTYTDVATAGTLLDGTATSVRITGAAGSVATGGLAGDTLTINTLSRAVAGLATIDTAGKTLRIRNGVLSNASSGGITIGTTAGSGTLTAGSVIDTAGTLDMNTPVGNVTVNSNITNNGTGVVNLSKMGAAELILSGTNTFTGGTTATAGTLRLGSNSALGTGGVTLLGSTTIGTLSGGPTNVSVANDIAINNSSTLTLSLTNGSLTLGGVVSGNAVMIGGSAANSVTLTNTSTYTGATAVSAGKLLLGNGGNLAATTTTVASGAFFGVSQNTNSTTNSTAGAITLNAGGGLTMADGFTTTLNATSTVALTGGAGSTLSFDLCGATTAADRLAITGAASGTGGTTIAINGIGTTAPTTGSYTIITAASGLNTANLTLAKTKTVINGTAYGISLTNTATTSAVNVTGLSGLDAAYWTADQGGVWNTNNTGNTSWSTAADGLTDSGATPNAVTDVFFNATGATNLTTTLGADTTIYSLNYTGTSSATTLEVGNTLTIGTAGAISPGINVASGSAAQTINAPIVLGAAQSWTNSSTNALTIGGAVTNGGFGLTLAGTGPTTIGGAIAGSGALTVTSTGTVLVSGGISGGGAISVTGASGTTTLSGNITGASSLAKSGAGTLTISGTNSYTGGTTLTAGTLKVGSSAGLGAAGQTLALNGGTLQLASDTAVLSKNVNVGGSATVVLDRDTSGAGLTTTFGNLNTTAASSTITVNNGSNVTSGTSTLAFSGTLSLSGQTTTFAIGAGAAVNLSGGTAGGAQTNTVVKNGAGTLIFSGNAGTWDGGAVTLSAGTLDLRTRMGDTSQFSAPITASAGTTIRLAADTGTQYVSSTTVSGNMQVVADRVTSAAISTTHSLGNLSIGAFTLNIARGSNITGAGIAGVTFNESIVGAAVGTGTTTLTGNATFNTDANTLLTLKGVTSGAFSLTKTGLGSMTLVAANTYSGGTIVNGGTLNLGFGTTTTNILASGGALTLGGGTLNLTGTGTQTVAGLSTSLASSSNITLATNETLTLGALTSAGAGSTLNINTVAGGANATSSTIGTGIVTLTGQTPGSSINIGYTVTDAGGTGLATVNASNQVVRLTAAISTLLPAAGSVVATDYLIDNNAGGVAADGSSSLTVTTSESARTISVDTTAAAGILTLNSGAVLSNNGWLFSGTGSNTYKITGAGTLTAAASGNPITFNNMNTGAVTIESVIAANGTNNVGFTGPGTTILTATNTYTGSTGIGSGIVQVGAGASLDGLATTGALPATTVTIASGAKLIYNRAGQANALAGAGAVEFYGNNNGTTGGANVNVALNNGSTAFSGTMLVSGIRAAVDNAGDVGTAQVTITPTGQIFAGAQTLASNFIISGIGWGEATYGSFGALRLDGTTVNGSITMAADSRIGAANATGTINGAIGETGGARKLQIGGALITYSTTLTLNAANTYTGGTDIGTSTSPVNNVNVGNNLAFGTGTVNVLSGGTVASSGAARTLANAFTIGSGKTLTLNGTAGLLTLNGGVTGAGAVAVSGGTVLLNGTNNYTAATTITAGTLQIGGSVNPGSANLTLGSASTGTLTILNGGSFTTTGQVNLGSGIIGNVLNINAGGSLSVATINNAWQTTYNIDGTLTASGAWSITPNATTNINGAATGVITAASITTGNSSGTVVNYNSLGTLTISGNLTMGSGTATAGAVNQNAGTMNIGGLIWGLGTQVFTLNGGRLNVGATGIGSTGATSRTVNLNNGTVGASGNWSSAQPLVLGGTTAGTTFNTLDSVDNSTARTITLSGILSGTGKLVKEGTGTLTLSNTGNQTYAGTTTVNAGTMIVAGTLANNGAASVLMAAPDASLAGNPILTRAIGTGLNAYAGFGSSVTAASLDPVLNVGLQTQASILMSGNNATANNMTMQWRTRTTGEAAGSNPNAVLSDVVDLSGMGSDLFVMQMSYTDAALTNLGLNESNIALSGELRLGWNDGGVWKTAFAGNSVPTGTFAGAISWSTFVTNNGVALDGSNLGSYLGAYGVDPTTNVVWAVLDHNSEFAVIPEPSTLVLGGLAMLGLASAGLRRRRAAKAA